MKRGKRGGENKYFKYSYHEYMYSGKRDALHGKQAL